MELTIDTAAVASLLGLLATIIGFIWAAFRLYGRLEKTEKTVKDLKGTQEIVVKACFGILDGLHQQGCNGEVTKAREMLKNHIIEH